MFCIICFTNKVVWTRLYKTSSSQEGGTLYQLRNLINRRNVVCNPKNDMNSCEDFFELVTTAHIIVAAMKIFGMSKIDDKPDETLLPSDTDNPAMVLKAAVKKILSSFVDLSFPVETKKRPQSMDHIHEYGKEVLTMGLFLLEFKDLIRLGAGERDLRCWKFMFLFFRATGHTNYALESFNLLCHYYYLLPPRYAEQLIWSRFVNTHGSCGRNVSGDLHMEHLNRVCKDAVAHLGANKTPGAIVRIGKVVGVISNTLSNFDKVTGVTYLSGEHTRRSDSGDLKMIIEELLKSKVFDCIPNRKHHSFKSLRSNVFRSINKRKFNTWMTDNFKKLHLATNFNK